MSFSVTQLVGFGAFKRGSVAAAVDLDGSSEYLSKTFGGAGNTRIATLSFWVRRGSTGGANPHVAMMADAGGGNEDEVYISTGNYVGFMFNGGSYICLSSTTTLTSTTSWYHILCAIDTTNATAAQRVRIYVNGSEETVSTQPAQNTTFNGWGQAKVHNIGRNNAGARHYLNGDMALIHFIDGQQLTPSSFYSGGNAVQYTGAYGSNGFLLDFAASGDMGNDVSGNNNDFTLNSIDSSDQILDGPTKNY